MTHAVLTVFDYRNAWFNRKRDSPCLQKIVDLSVRFREKSPLANQELMILKKGSPPMKDRFYHHVLRYALVAMIVAMARPALAVLGESADSVSADRKALAAVRGATLIQNGYTIQEVVSDATTVREYISPNNIVFGVAWNGLASPDIAGLLGSYAGEYKEALKRAPSEPGRRFRQVKSTRVIVETWGHMRNLQGRAYAPALIPQGVTVDEIK